MADPSELAHTAWEQALDALERDLEQAEEIIDRRESGQAAEILEWAVPDLSSRLPAALVERATQLAARQRVLIERLPDAIAAVRRQSAVTTKMSRSSHSPHQASVYIDTIA